MSDTGTSYDPAGLTAALLRNARGDDGHQAALTLLAEHDYWLTRIAHHHPQFVMASEEGAPFRLNWVDIAKALLAGDLYASASQQAVLSAALSLQVYGYAIRLGLDGLRGLDATNTAAVLRAIATANGHRQLAAAITTGKG